MSADYLAPKDDGSEKIIRRHIPPGIAWLAWVTPGKTAYKLLKALAGVFDDAWSRFYQVVTDELSPYTTDELLPEWEKALGLPDKCIGPQSDKDARRDMILLRLSRKRYTTLEHWVTLAEEVFGLEVTITPGWYVQKPCLFPAEFPMRFDIYPKLGRFRIYIDIHNVEFGGFPYDGTSIPDHKFPIPFGNPNEGFKRFQCFIERIRPSNVVIIWNNNPLNDPIYTDGGSTVPLEIPSEIY